MPRLTLRRKLLLFAIAIAVAPILLAGQTIIRIAQDELKSSANEQLLGIAGGIAREVNDVVERSWLEPLVLLRNALDDDQLGVQEKIALLTLGISDITDIVALQLTVEGTYLPLVVVQDAFSARLRAAGLDPLEVLRVPPESVDVLRAAADVLAQDVTPVAATDDWLATVVLPLGSRIAGADATLTARIDLHRLRELVSDDPFTRSGFITVVDRTGHEVFDPERREFRVFDDGSSNGTRIVREAEILTVTPLGPAGPGGAGAGMRKKYAPADVHFLRYVCG